MGEIASQITSRDIVYSTVYSGADQSKHQSSASLAFVWGIHRGPVNSPHKWPVTWKMFPFDYVIMLNIRRSWNRLIFNVRIPILVRRHLYIETHHLKKFTWWLWISFFKSLASGWCGCNFKLLIFKLVWRIDILSLSCVISLRWPHWWLVNIGLGNNLVPSGNKPLLEPMLI